MEAMIASDINQKLGQTSFKNEAKKPKKITFEICPKLCATALVATT